jgi:hypothetical protein
MQFVEIDAAGHVRTAGPAPYLDHQPLGEDERALVAPALEAGWLRDDLQGAILGYAAEDLTEADA